MSWPYFFMLWHVVVAEQFFLRVTVVHYFLICVVFGVDTLKFYVFVGVMMWCAHHACFSWSPPFLVILLIMPPSHLWMGHFVWACHTLLTIVTARHGNITFIFTYHVVFICYFCTHSRDLSNIITACHGYSTYISTYHICFICCFST